VVVIAAWAVSARVNSLVPPVGPTLTQVVKGFTEGWVLAPMWDTMKAVLGGFLLALTVGFGVGYALGRVQFLATVFDPVVAGLFAVPRIVFYPVLIATFGVTTTAKLWMGVLSAFFPIVLSTAAGIKAVNPVQVRLGRSMNCSRWQLATKIFLPAAAPTIMTGVRIGLASGSASPSPSSPSSSPNSSPLRRDWAFWFWTSTVGSFSHRCTQW
jgi:NitT/TauT family transport system permease protein